MLVLLLVSALAAPQDGVTACNFDTAGHVRTDSVVVTLAAGARVGSSSAVQNEYADAAEVIHEYFLPPSQLTLPMWARTYWKGSVAYLDTDDPPHGLDGEVRFRLDSAARVVDGSIDIQTLNVDLAKSVGAAILRADSARAFARPSTKLLHDDGMIRLHFATMRSKDPHVPLMRVIVPALQIERVPTLDWIPEPDFRSGLPTVGYGDRLLLQFVIDASGHVDSTSLTVVQSHYAEFANEASRLIKAARFRPAKIGNCSVPILARLPIDFTQPITSQTRGFTYGALVH